MACCPTVPPLPSGPALPTSGMGCGTPRPLTALATSSLRMAMWGSGLSPPPDSTFRWRLLRRGPGVRYRCRIATLSPHGCPHGCPQGCRNAAGALCVRRPLRLVYHRSLPADSPSARCGARGLDAQGEDVPRLDVFHRSPVVRGCERPGVWGAQPSPPALGTPECGQGCSGHRDLLGESALVWCAAQGYRC